MPQVGRRYTRDEVLALPADGNRYELIGGELIVSPAPSPRHQRVVSRLADLLGAYLKPLGLGDTLWALPADVSWDHETLVQPDLFVVPPEEVTNRWTTYRTLLLVVEVLSPSSRRTDRVRKRGLYRMHDAQEYWIVDHEAGLVEVWRPGEERPEIVTERLTWRLRPDLEALAIDLPALFRDLPA